MLNFSDNLQVFSVVKGISSRLRVYRDKPHHVLVYKHNGQSSYTFGNKTLLLKQGQVLFIPKGQTYQVVSSGEDVSYYTAIYFSGDVLSSNPIVFETGNQTELNRAFLRILHSWTIPSPDSRFRTMSLFYSILAQITAVREEDYASKRRADTISPAVQYLKENLFRHELKVSQLHQLCGISDTYFRSIFRAVYKVSPQRYVTTIRMRQAKQILENRECASVTEAAMLVGYQDPLYFSRIFKQHFDITPSELLK